MTDRRHTPLPLSSLWRKVWGGETSHRTSTGDKPMTEEASTKSAADAELCRMASDFYWAVKHHESTVYDCLRVDSVKHDREKLVRDLEKKHGQIDRWLEERVWFIYDLGRAKGREERGEEFAELLNTAFANLLPTGFTVNFEQQAEVRPTENADFYDTLKEEYYS